MTTDYNQIADQYKQAKQAPWRIDVEQYTMKKLLGDLSGRCVLDLACGAGFYTRVAKGLGADRVVGVDLAQAQIDLARAEEPAMPRGIDYVVADAAAYEPRESFDVVIAAYLLNYARSAEELHTLCRAACRALKPGGRLVALNNNPAQPLERFPITRKYGFTKVLRGDLREGAPVVYIVHLDDGDFEIENYHIDAATHEQALAAAGLNNICWHGLQVSPETGMREPGYWDDLLHEPAVIFIEGEKQS